MSIEGEVRKLIEDLVFKGTMETWNKDFDLCISAILKLTEKGVTNDISNNSK